MKKRPLEAVYGALAIKCDALGFLARITESLQCAKDMYNMWALARGPAHPMTIQAAFYLIEALIHNKEYEDAEFYARTLWEILHTKNHRENDIPADRREEYVGKAADSLAKAIFRLAERGGIPPEEKQKAGEEAIALARQSKAIRIQLCDADSVTVARGMFALSSILNYFKNDDDDEVLRLLEQGIAIEARMAGRMSMNVGVAESNLGAVYHKRAKRALDANDMERCEANLELALPHCHEAARIYTAIDHMDAADRALRMVVDTENKLRQVGIIRTAAAAATAAAARS